MIATAPPPETKRLALAQIVFCQGCCCGRTDRGKPELPAERLKSVWKSEKLNRTVQLTISGCLGPCDLTNVALLMTGDSQTWLGRLAGADTYESLIDWARRCHAAGAVLPLPAGVAANRFERFAPEEVPA